MKNILKNTKVYLAGNMEHSDDSVNWRDYLKSELNKLNIRTLSPLDVVFINQQTESEEDRTRLKKMRSIGNLDEVSSYMRLVVQKDLRLIDLSDFIIINLEVNKPTFGTLHELIIATQQKKPIFLSVGDRNSCPLWLLGIIKPKYIYNNIEDILSIIRDIDSGKKEIDVNRWRLLDERYR